MYIFIYLFSEHSHANFYTLESFQTFQNNNRFISITTHDLRAFMVPILLTRKLKHRKVKRQVSGMQGSHPWDLASESKFFTVNTMPPMWPMSMQLCLLMRDQVAVRDRLKQMRARVKRLSGHLACRGIIPITVLIYSFKNTHNCPFCVPGLAGKDKQTVSQTKHKTFACCQVSPVTHRQ